MNVLQDLSAFEGLSTEGESEANPGCLEIATTERFSRASCVIDADGFEDPIQRGTAT